MISSSRSTYASADAYVRMNDGRKVTVSPDGLKIVITSWGEHAIISQSITQNGLTRFAMVSDNTQATTNFVGASSGNPVGTLTVQYLVGCQFPEDGATVNAQLTIYQGNYQLGIYPVPMAGVTPVLKATSAPSVLGTVYPNGIGIEPGAVAILPVGNADIVNGSAIIQIDDLEVTPQAAGGQGPCAGYAQARSYQKVNISTPTYSLESSLYGQAFGIG